MCTVDHAVVRPLRLGLQLDSFLDNANDHVARGLYNLIEYLRNQLENFIGPHAKLSTDQIRVSEIQ